MKSSVFTGASLPPTYVPERKSEIDVLPRSRLSNPLLALFGPTLIIAYPACMF